MTHARYLRIVWLSALYDLIATASFATPWTARFTLHQLAALGFGGAAMRPPNALDLLFITMFGSIVTIWSVVRLRRPSVELGIADGIGRVVFALWQAYALGNGVNHVVGVFLVFELGFAIAQLGGAAALGRTARRAA